VFGYELRMARNRYQGDSSYVTCPLRRTACRYSDSGATILCNKAMDAASPTFLVGYTLTVEVGQYEESMAYWRGVSKCSIQAFERNHSLAPGEAFTEHLVMLHPPSIKTLTFDYYKLLVLLVFVLFVAYCLLYFCRQKHCVYCNKKLVFSKQLCKCYMKLLPRL
jgi:hypothetical protein